MMAPSLSRARNAAMTAIRMTTPLAIHMRRPSGASFLANMRYRSLDTAEDATRSWESAVDMTAAMIAAYITAAMAAGNRDLDSSTNTFSAFGSPASPKYALPTSPTMQVNARQMTIQRVATRLDILRSLGFLMAVYLTTMWGIPKYPRPHARADMIAMTPMAVPLEYMMFSKCSGTVDMLWRMSMVLSHPPSALMAASGTRTSAKTIRIP